ncbi:D-alanine--D-alanine ligase [Bacillus alkalicola]|uniref:D-alanine--D-alanine ligase n=1 Tax=Evansella alkalicola TaxID=745819 RepID=A0ABS6K242_9BACI|nr:D-alanine--D-alanine ligase [Bacillus alkalicola]MBU9723615.1 D-alanine--D-alanine ligase [Bacillus alkalicola]
MKKKVAILFGGNSTEHQVSLQSVKSIVHSIDKRKYDVVLIGVDKEGKWYLYDNLDSCIKNSHDPNSIELVKSDKRIALIPGNHIYPFIELPSGKVLGKIDVIFPLLHGGRGEDGSMQGLFRITNMPFVGSSVLASAICMDKDFTKRILLHAGLKVANYTTFTKNEENNIHFKKIKKQLGLPVFIKPANQGSSVGVSKVESEDEFHLGIEAAFSYDNKIIVEEAIDGREIECAVLGNNYPISSLPGEVMTNSSFYSYEAKYIDEKDSQLIVPAVLEDTVVKKMKLTAIKAFEAIQCEGLARIDFFLTKDNDLIINEINTLPGFTKQSMYPKLWEASGRCYKDLIDDLIRLAIERGASRHSV